LRNQEGIDSHEPEGREFESLRARKAFDLPKTFLRLRTKSQTADFPMTLAKWFFENSLVDSKGLEFYHRDWEFLSVLGQNPPLSAMSTRIFQCYWKFLKHQELSFFRLFRYSLSSLPISLQSPLFSS
jgi:hypothetical protein